MTLNVAYKTLIKCIIIIGECFFSSHFAQMCYQNNTLIHVNIPILIPGIFNQQRPAFFPQTISRH